MSSTVSLYISFPSLHVGWLSFLCTDIYIYIYIYLYVLNYVLTIILRTFSYLDDLLSRRDNISAEGHLGQNAISCTGSSEMAAEIQRLQAELSLKDNEISRLQRTVNCQKNELSHLRAKNNSARSKSKKTSSPPRATRGQRKKAKTSQTEEAPSIEDAEHLIEDLVRESNAPNPSFFPTASIMKKHGIDTPYGWAPGVLYMGDINFVGDLPGPSTLSAWLLNNVFTIGGTSKIKINSNVVIGPSRIKERGKGLYAAIDMNPTKVVGYYSGHLRPRQEQHDSRYVAAVEVLYNGQAYEIDALYCGNEMRYINHFMESENEQPNVKLESVETTGKIKVVATQGIKAGDEILLNYGPDAELFLEK